MSKHKIESLARQIGTMLTERKWTISVAESCTGGLIGGALTSISGSSDFFRGGVIAYDNTVKQQLLHVPGVVLQRVGAVSHETVKAMAEGVAQLFGTNCAISVSGIAGPGGGTPEKAVGLVYIGIGIEKKTKSFEYHFHGDRRKIREASVETALDRVIELLQ